MAKPEAQAAPAPSSPDTDLVRELAGVLNDTGLSEIEVERGDLRIRVAKTLSVPSTATIAAAPTAVAGPTAAHASASTAPQPPAGDQVKSPMVGTVYLQAQPGAPAFAKVGDKVSEGQTLLLIEAMKTMNPVTAPRAGTVAAILVADGQPVEYGEPLAVIG